MTDETIAEPECWQLLESQELGHVALSIAALPAVVPVAYTVDAAESTIGLYTRQPTTETALDSKVIAFEVDGIDERTHRAWIVHVIGTAHVTTATNDGPGGVPRRVVQLTPTVITGQRLPDAQAGTRRG